MSGIVGQNLGRGSGLVKKTAVAADAVTGSEIADDAIDSEHYTDGSIDNAHIADDAIDSEHYAAGSVDTAHIADNQVTLAKMAGGTDGNIISFDASGDPVAIATGSDGQVLTSTGAGSPPAFEAVAAGGITHASQWNGPASAVVGSMEPITSWNEMASPTAFSQIGASMTQSSGVFTFPTTGHWRIGWKWWGYGHGGDAECGHIIKTCVDFSTGPSFTYASQTSSFLNYTRGGTAGMLTYFMDVTDTAEQKVVIWVQQADADNTTYGATAYHQSYADFVRSADT